MEEVELLPSGLAVCLLNGIEVRILKITPESLTIRISEEIENIDEMKIGFYIFDKYEYKEIIINEFIVNEKVKEKFFVKYVFTIDDLEYFQNVKRIFKDYSQYIMLKTYGEDGEFSKKMAGYPSEKDYDFYKDFSKAKREWISKLNYENFDEHIIDSVELGIKLDNDVLYKKYLNKDIKQVKDEYLKENSAENHILFKKDISRIYIGNEFCHNLFPNENTLVNMMEKAKNENLNITICFTYLRDCYIEKTEIIIDKLYSWCRRNNIKAGIIINDWGMLKMIQDKTDYFDLSLGVLLNKRKKDPRYFYKKGYSENKDLMAENSLNSPFFNEYLKSQHINRYEYENCGYRMSIAEGNHSLHMPFYVTNTSQYCTLYAICTNLDRGKQKLVTSCPKYCENYVFAYPEHLRMVGRYNSLFAFDDTLLKDPEELSYYVKSGIDRIVLNFM